MEVFDHVNIITVGNTTGEEGKQGGRERGEGEGGGERRG